MRVSEDGVARTEFRGRRCARSQPLQTARLTTTRRGGREWHLKQSLALGAWRRENARKARRKLDESSAGARLSAQMLGGQVKMHIGVIGMQSLAYDALFSLCTQKLLSLYGPKEDMSVHSNQRQRSLDMHCLFVYLAYLWWIELLLFLLSNGGLSAIIFQPQLLHI